MSACAQLHQADFAESWLSFPTGQQPTSHRTDMHGCPESGPRRFLAQDNHTGPCCSMWIASDCYWCCEPTPRIRLMGVIHLQTPSTMSPS